MTFGKAIANSWKSSSQSADTADPLKISELRTILSLCTWHMRWLSTVRICSTLAWESPFSLPFSWCPAAPRLGWEGGGKGPGRRMRSDSAFQMASNLSLKEHAICLQMGGTWWDNVVHVSFEWAKVAKD